MRKFVLLSCLLIVSPNTFLSAEEDYWQQFVHYTMDVTLIPVQKALIGEETVRYTNNSPDTLRKFYMHLYPNAYRGPESIMAKEASRYYRTLVEGPDDAGFLRIDSFKILPPDSIGEDESLTAFKINDTILEADLPRPLPPGHDMTVEISFFLKIRKFLRRAGYRGNQYDFAQWYPKVCVYDESGWNAEPFHYQGEFYGEFGTFDVTIHVPFEYIVGATGVVVEGNPGWELACVDTSWSYSEWRDARQQKRLSMQKGAQNGKVRTVTFHAEKVHDFAWVTCPDFLYESGEWDGIPIHVLYRSHVKDRWSKVVLKRAARALEWLSAKFGRYPYPQLTVAHGLLGGGMEYPMLVMNASERESLILHEVGHIYFFGILANNEWKEAWLDEGFTTFQTRWYMETKYGKWGQDRETSLKQANWLQRHRPSKTRRERRRDSALAFMNSDHNEPISRISYRFNEPLAYSVNAYTKGSLLLDMLKYVVGDSTFEKICRAYFDRWAFKHVNEERFKNVCEDVSGRELDWFFNQWLHDTVTVDYALADVGKHKVKGNWYTEVSILRKDRGKMPVEVELTTESGETFLKRWHGMHESGKVLFQTTSKPRRVLLDPNDAVLDKYRLNNGPLKLEVVFDYPNMSYNPRDAYLITWRPSGWYNSVDKLRIGGRLKGRYGASRNAGLGAWYGVDSKELDARFTYSNPITPLGPNIRGAAGIQKMEGRFEVDAHLAYSGGKFIAHPPKHRFWVGFNHSRLLEGKGDRYTIREFDQKTDTTLTTWEEGVVNNLYFRYNYDPRGLNWFSNLSAGLDIVLDDWTSDFDYRRAFAELRFWLPKNDEGVFLRFYTAKVFSSERAPLQDLVFLEGANPRERFKRFYLRSDGALPEELHYHLPGGGNVRGYYNQPIFGDQIVALNLELRNTFRPQLFGKRLDKFLGETSLVAFVDLASMEFIGSQNDFFAGAGLGLRFQNVLPDNWYTLFTGGRHVTLRLDFPIWIDDPLPNENAVRFRWVFGFEQAI